MAVATGSNIALTISRPEKFEKDDITQVYSPKSRGLVTTSASDDLLTQAKCVIWREIYAEVPLEATSKMQFGERKCRVVLDQVNGIAEAGELTFIMGASGAGKTTLLNILTQRNLRGIRVYGEVLINKTVLDPGSIRKISAYVQQEDAFIPELTVRETILLAARLRMRSKSTPQQKVNRVDEVIQEMGLLNCRDTRIGGRYTKSISRGEKKRLAFACEILTDPPILFCDEPTSGLDAYMAQQVISVLKKLSLDGKTVISTIHQPSSQVYELADKLCLMANGHVAYQGDAADVMAFFSSAGFPQQSYSNPSDHFMRVLSKAENESEETHGERVNKIIQFYERSQYGENVEMITHHYTPSTGSGRTRRVKAQYSSLRRFQANYATQLYYLTIRSFKTILRNPMVLRIRLVQVMVCAAIIGSIFMQTKMEHMTIQSFMGVMFNSVRDMNFMFCFPCISVFTSDLPVVMSEYQSSMYHPSAYFLAKNIADTVQYFVFPTVYSVIVFFMSIDIHDMTHQVPGMDVADNTIMWTKFFKFTLVNIVLATASTSTGYAAACIFGTLDIATQYLPLMLIPLFVFGGFFVNLSVVKPWFRWLEYFSWYRFAFEAHMNNMFDDIPDIKGCNNTDNYLFCHTKNTSTHHGHDLMTYHAMRKGFYWSDIGVLCLMIFVLRLLAVVALQIRISLK